jgi:VWFA-related protein
MMESWSFLKMKIVCKDVAPRGARAPKQMVWMMLAAVLFTAGNARGFAQDAASQAPTLHVNARLVVLDVVVTDKQGKPVEGLKREDFNVLEDNVPQTVRSFEPPAAHALPASEASAQDAAMQVFDPAKPTTFGQSPATILVLDQLNTHFADSSFARRELASYLGKQPEVLDHPTTLVTLYQDHFNVLQEFTRDRAKLQHALNAAPVKYSWSLELNGKAEHSPLERLDTSLRALESMAESYARIPGRKNIIWIGGGFPSIDPETLASNDFHEVQDEMKHVTDVLLDARVTLYAVDPTSHAAGMNELTDFQQIAFAQLSGELGSASIDPMNTGGDFDSLGALTGGRVIRTLNNVADQIALSVDYADRYYTIAYSPTNASQDAVKFRHIRVLCTKPGTVVTTRTGYYAGKPTTEDLTQRMAYDLSTAAESSVPLNGLHVTSKTDPSVAVLNDAWIVSVAAPGLTWDAQPDGTSDAKVAVMAVSLDKHGKMLGHAAHYASATARPGVNLGDEGKMAVFNFTAQAALKAVTMRFVVRDATNGRMGTFDVPLK